MLKELFARIIQPTENPVTANSPDQDDIHEKIRKSVLKLLSDAGFPNIVVTVGPKNGCSHETCTIDADVNWPNIPLSEADEQHKAFIECARNAFFIVINEIVGSREILSFRTTKTINGKPI